MALQLRSLLSPLTRGFLRQSPRAARAAARAARGLASLLDLDVVFGWAITGVVATIGLLWVAAALGFAWYVFQRCTSGCLP